ncbi:MAG TPA: hypothetical protein VGW12_12145 [Pyrinomonadaceae bacterium]|nr:hypothetical protein [Pyrinomonadaceae bacterium]
MRRFYPLIWTLVLLVVTASAQETARKQDTPKPPLPRLAVEIRNEKDRPTYISATGGVWFGRFRRIQTWSPPANFLPVLAVDFSSSVVDERTLKIKVSLHRGERQFDEQTEVAVYDLAEGETTVAEKLKEFGVEPIEFSVVRVRPQTRVLPYFESQVSALQLVGIEPRETLFPSYVMRLRNLSGKDIAALRVTYLNEQGQLILTGAQNPRDETLIKAGEVYELRANGGASGEMMPEGYAPDGLQKVSVLTVLFMDGTFEGQPQKAAEMIALKHGRKLQLTRAVALMQKTLQASNEDEATAAKRFRAQVSALKEEVEPQTVDYLAQRFPTLSAKDKNRLHDGVRFYLHRVKTDLLKAVAEFAASPDRVTFREWLERTRDDYEKWIGRL